MRELCAAMSMRIKKDLATEFPERRTKMRKQCDNVSRTVYAIRKMCVCLCAHFSGDARCHVRARCCALLYSKNFLLWTPLRWWERWRSARHRKNEGKNGMNGKFSNFNSFGLTWRQFFVFDIWRKKIKWMRAEASGIHFNGISWYLTFSLCNFFFFAFFWKCYLSCHIWRQWRHWNHRWVEMRSKIWIFFF